MHAASSSRTATTRNAHHGVTGSVSRQVALVVVEDNEDDFTLLKRALSKAGITSGVCWAQHAGEALHLLAKLAETQRNICVVADVRLGLVDGFELLESVRSVKAYEGVRLVILTGMFDQRTEARAKKQSVDAFFVKPSKSEEWLELARALQKLALQ